MLHGDCTRHDWGGLIVILVLLSSYPIACILSSGVPRFWPRVALYALMLPATYFAIALFWGVDTRL